MRVLFRFCLLLLGLVVANVIGAAEVQSENAAESGDAPPAEATQPPGDTQTVEAEAVQPAASKSLPAKETPPQPKPPAQAKPVETPAAAQQQPQPPAIDLTPLVQSNAALSARMAMMEQLILSQSKHEAEVYRDTNRLITIFGVSFAAMGVIALIVAVYLNFRALRLVQPPPTGGSAFPAYLSAPQSPAGGADVPGMERIKSSGQRFQNRMSSLEARLAEIEQMAGARPIPEKETDPVDTAIAAPADSQLTGLAPETEPKRVVPVAAILVHKAETLVNLDKKEEALDALERALQAGDINADLHLARGRVLERMGRLGDALKAYELAVVGDERNASALLMKAGILNRQERFAEALACYERALELSRQEA